MDFLRYTRDERVIISGKSRINKFALFICPVCKEEVEKIYYNGVRIRACSVICSGKQRTKQSKHFQTKVIRNKALPPKAKRDKKTMLQITEGLIIERRNELETTTDRERFDYLMGCLEQLLAMQKRLI